jgi:23S rRNA (uridine2552-2'-O)-methyltransferase
VGKAWVKGRKRDPYYRRAKAEGYRSRAAFKLIQIDARFDLIYEGDTVLDLGSAPGGWSQVAKVLVGDSGRIIAADLVGMRPLAGVDVWKGDLTDPEFIESLVREIGAVDVVISDMSPRLSGTKTLDHERSLALAETALAVAVRVLRPRGHFLAKVFQGPALDAFKERVASEFETAKGHAPEASRKESREFYVVGKGFRGTPTRRRRGPARA